MTWKASRGNTRTHNDPGKHQWLLDHKTLTPCTTSDLYGSHASWMWLHTNWTWQHANLYHYLYIAARKLNCNYSTKLSHNLRNANSTSHKFNLTSCKLVSPSISIQHWISIDVMKNLYLNLRHANLLLWMLCKTGIYLLTGCYTNLYWRHANLI